MNLTLGSLQHSWHEPSPLPTFVESVMRDTKSCILYIHVHVYQYTENSLSFLIVSSFHSIVNPLSKPSFACLRLLRKFRPNTTRLIKENIKALPPSVDFLLFWYCPNCNGFASVVMHGWTQLCMFCSTNSGLVKGRIAFFPFFSLDHLHLF